MDIQIVILFVLFYCKGSMSAGLPDNLIVNLQSPDASQHIVWIKTVFSASEIGDIILSKDGTNILRATLLVNKGLLYVSDRSTAPENGVTVPEREPHTLGVHLDVSAENGPVFFQKAVDNGATVIVPFMMYSFGTYGKFKDPYGFNWGIFIAPVVDGVKPVLGLEPGKAEPYVDRWLVGVLGAEIVKYESDGHFFSRVSLNGGLILVVDDPIDLEPDSPDIVVVLEYENNSDAIHSRQKMIDNDAVNVVDYTKQAWGQKYGSVQDTVVGVLWGIASKD